MDTTLEQNISAQELVSRLHPDTRNRLVEEVLTERRAANFWVQSEAADSVALVVASDYLSWTSGVRPLAFHWLRDARAYVEAQAPSGSWSCQPDDLDTIHYDCRSPDAAGPGTSYMVVHAAIRGA